MDIGVVEWIFNLQDIEKSLKCSKIVLTERQIGIF